MLTTTLSAVLVLSVADFSESGWDTDYAEALNHVRSDDKPLFIVFDTGASENGLAVQSGVFMNERVERTLSDDFVRLFVDIDTESGRLLAADFGVIEYPRIVVIDRSGDWQVYRRSGVHSADEVQSLLGRFRRTKVISAGSVGTAEWSVPAYSSGPATSATLCKT